MTLQTLILPKVECCLGRAYLGEGDSRQEVARESVGGWVWDFILIFRFLQQKQVHLGVYPGNAIPKYAHGFRLKPPKFNLFLL